MADFKSHVAGGAVVSGALAIISMNVWSVPILGLPSLILSGLVGSMAPDLDSDQGRPIQLLAFSFLAWSLSLGFLSMAYGNMSPLVLTTIALTIFIFTRYILRALFAKFTRHRGLFHSIPMGLFMSSLLVLANQLQEVANFWLIGIFFLAGFVTHLLLDELWSVNLAGVRVKRSFGTAFKLVGKPAAAGILLYVASLGLLFLSFITESGRR